MLIDILNEILCISISRILSPIWSLSLTCEGGRFYCLDSWIQMAVAALGFDLVALWVIGSMLFSSATLKPFVLTSIK